jgi:hypothetical protein
MPNLIGMTVAKAETTLAQAIAQNRRSDSGPTAEVVSQGCGPTDDLGNPPLCSIKPGPDWTVVAQSPNPNDLIEGAEYHVQLVVLGAAPSAG